MLSHHSVVARCHLLKGGVIFAAAHVYTPILSAFPFGIGGNFCWRFPKIQCVLGIFFSPIIGAVRKAWSWGRKGNGVQIASRKWISDTKVAGSGTSWCYRANKCQRITRRQTHCSSSHTSVSFSSFCFSPSLIVKHATYLSLLFCNLFLIFASCLILSSSRMQNDVKLPAHLRRK